MQPAIYPLLGVVHVLRTPQLLFRVLSLLLQELLIPVYWVSETLVRRHHRAVFREVLQQQRVWPVVPVSASEQKQLQHLTAQRKDELRRKQQQEAANARGLVQAPTVPSEDQEGFHTSLPRVMQSMLWLFTPPNKNDPPLQYYGKKLVNAPFRLIFPAGYRLLGVRDTRAYATMAVSDYLNQKGISTPEAREAVSHLHANQFRQFGAVTYALGFLPIISWLTNFTNTVGAALWAADMERSRFRLVPEMSKEE